MCVFHLFKGTIVPNQPLALCTRLEHSYIYIKIYFEPREKSNLPITQISPSLSVRWIASLKPNKFPCYTLALNGGSVLEFSKSDLTQVVWVYWARGVLWFGSQSWGCISLDWNHQVCPGKFKYSFSFSNIVAGTVLEENAREMVGIVPSQSPR